MENPHIVKILKIEQLTHNVKMFVLERPKGYEFIPGQAIDLAIDKGGWRDKERPFTFTGLNSNKHLELTIKIYPERNGVTKELGNLKERDELIISNPWGAIQYKDKGVFIAGGAGITPFIAILRDLQLKNELAGNMLLFSNKKEEDVILREEFERMKTLKKVYTLTREDKARFEHGRIDESFLKKHISNFKQSFYICGPLRMVGELTSVLTKLGAETESIVVET